MDQHHPVVRLTRPYLTALTAAHQAIHRDPLDIQCAILWLYANNFENVACWLTHNPNVYIQYATAACEAVIVLRYEDMTTNAQTTILGDKLHEYLQQRFAPLYIELGDQ